jgi:pimeloyl-ACP methyl ester carboxylesterase
MFNAIPGCRIAILPGVGHLANLEAPEPFNAQLAEFLTPRQTFGVGGGGSGKW